MLERALYCMVMPRFEMEILCSSEHHVSASASTATRDQANWPAARRRRRRKTRLERQEEARPWPDCSQEKGSGWLAQHSERVARDSGGQAHAGDAHERETDLMPCPTCCINVHTLISTAAFFFFLQGKLTRTNGGDLRDFYSCSPREDPHRRLPESSNESAREK